MSGGDYGLDPRGYTSGALPVGVAELVDALG
jgi:hypothetical protein